jgi:hypothetical protein
VLTFKSDWVLPSWWRFQNLRSQTHLYTGHARRQHQRPAESRSAAMLQELLQAVPGSPSQQCSQLATAPAEVKAAISLAQCASCQRSTMIKRTEQSSHLWHGATARLQPALDELRGACHERARQPRASAADHMVRDSQRRACGVDVCPVASMTLRSYRIHAWHASMWFAIHEGFLHLDRLAEDHAAESCPGAVTHRLGVPACVPCCHVMQTEQHCMLQP